MLTSAFFITFFRWVYYFYKYFWGANPNAQIIHLVLFIISLEMFIFSLWGLTPVFFYYDPLTLRFSYKIKASSTSCTFLLFSQINVLKCSIIFLLASMKMPVFLYGSLVEFSEFSKFSGV